MSERRVSVRLVVRGGDVVRAELEGVGDAGERAFERVGGAAERSGRLIAGVAARIMGALAAAFSAREYVRLADVWSDLSARVALAVGPHEDAAAVMARLAEVADRTYSAVGLTVEGWLGVEAVLRELGRTTEHTLDFVEALNNALVVSGARGERAEQVTRALTKAMAVGRMQGEELNTVLAHGGRVAQLLARELGIQTNALRHAGAQGRITAEVIERALVGSLEELRAEAEQMPATVGDAFVRLGNAAQTLVGTFDQKYRVTERVAAALVGLAEVLARSGALVERLAAYGAALGAVMAVRVVAGLAAAAAAAVKAAGALAILRGALLRAGIGLAAVALGEVVYQVAQAAERVGGLGELLGLLQGVASEALARVGMAFSGLAEAGVAAWADMRRAALSGLAGMLGDVAEAVNGITGLFGGAAAAVAESWSRIPAALGDLAYQAANSLIAGVEAMLNGVVLRINRFIEAVNAALALLPDWATGDGAVRIGTLQPVALGRIGNPLEGQAAQVGSDAGVAFRRGFEAWAVVDPTVLTAGLRGAAEEALRATNAAAQRSRTLLTAAGLPLESLSALFEALGGEADNAAAASERAAAAASAFAQALDGAGEEAATGGRARGGAGLSDAARRAAEWVERLRTAAEWHALVLASLNDLHRSGALDAAAYEAAVGAVAPMLSLSGEGARDVARQILELNALFAQGAIDAELYGRGLARVAAEAAAAAQGAAGGWAAAARALQEYAAAARSVGEDIGQALTRAFSDAEQAVAEFVRTGKLDFGELVASMIADLARLAARTYIFGPLANWIGGVIGSFTGAAVLHEGGVAGSGGVVRQVPAVLFGLGPGGRLGPDEVPAILQRGEVVLSRRQVGALERLAEAARIPAAVLHAGGVAGGGALPAVLAGAFGQGRRELPAAVRQDERRRGAEPAGPAVSVTIVARDAESFRQSRAQIAADLARAVALGRRGL